MSTSTCCDVDEFLRVLADETRQEILKLLQEGEMNVQELTERVGLEQSTVSYHLGRLQRVQLVSARRAGRQKFYRSNPACVAECSRAILGRISPSMLQTPGAGEREHERERDSS